MPLAAGDGVQTAARKLRLNAAGGACAVGLARENGGVKPPGLKDRPRPALDWLTRIGFAVRAHALLPASHSRPARILGPARRSESLACAAFARRRIAAPTAGGSTGVGGAPQGDALPSFARERRRQRDLNPAPRGAPSPLIFSRGP